MEIVLVVFTAVGRRHRFQGSRRPFCFIYCSGPARGRLCRHGCGLVGIIRKVVTLSGSKRRVVTETNSCFFIGHNKFSGVGVAPNGGKCYHLLYLGLARGFLGSCTRGGLMPIYADCASFCFGGVGRGAFLGTLFTSLTICSSRKIRLSEELVRLGLRRYLRLLAFASGRVITSLFDGPLIRGSLIRFVGTGCVFGTPLRRFTRFSNEDLSAFHQRFVQLFNTAPGG